MPKRIQRRRTKGWRMPENAVYVGRNSRWGNPWSVGKVACSCRSAGECTHNQFRCDTPAEAVDAYRQWINLILWGGNGRLKDELPNLRGKDLACWCRPDRPCHADVLLELANR